MNYEIRSSFLITLLLEFGQSKIRNMYFGGIPKKYLVIFQFNSLINIHHVQDRHERKDKIDVWILRNRIWPRMRGGMVMAAAVVRHGSLACLKSTVVVLMYNMTIRQKPNKIFFQIGCVVVSSLNSGNLIDDVSFKEVLIP